MFNAQRPDADDLPTSAQLVKATLIAAASAGAILVTIILPAEHAIDPTGIGSLLGLTEMGEIKAQLAEEAAADALADAAASAAMPTPPASAPAAAPATAEAAQAAVRTDVTRVTLAPGEAAEIKLRARKGAEITFGWTVEGGVVNYDTHGDAPGISYHGYGKGKASAGESGKLVAAFDGGHGWFWRNRGDAPVTVVLNTEGAYTEVRRVV